MPHSRTWYLVADGGQARILTRRATDASYETQVKWAATDSHQPSHELGTDRPGRTHESSGVVRHALEPRQDLHQAAKQAFVRRVAEALNQASAADEFDRLVLVAPARTLGDFHAALEPATQRKVVAQLQKDLTNVPDAGLAPHFVRGVGM